MSDNSDAERAKLALTEARRSADRLSSALDDFRQRAATIFTAGVLVTTFFGQAVGSDLRFLSWLAILIFVVGVVLPGVVIFFPQKDRFWFGLEPIGILKNRKKGESVIEIHEKAAKSLQNHLGATQERMRPLIALVQIQCVALGAEVVVWTLDLAGR